LLVHLDLEQRGFAGQSLFRRALFAFAWAPAVTGLAVCVARVTAPVGEPTADETLDRNSQKSFYTMTIEIKSHHY
jgi:hypothetical protein